MLQNNFVTFLVAKPRGGFVMMVLVAVVAAAQCLAFGQAGGNVEAGKAAYNKACKSCHGQNGEGNPAIARKLKVTLKDLRAADVQKRDDDAWRKQIVEGVGKMDPTEDVATDDVTNIIAFSRSLAPSQSPGSSGPPVPLAAAAAGDAAAGRSVYASECKSCHGANGEGNPTMAKKLKVAIRDLRLAEVQKQTDDEWKKDILQGVGKMDPTPDLPPADVANVIAFVRTLKTK